MKIPERDLPLFPLNTVLFPRIPLSLHVFEPRYQEMATRCLRERIGFGVLLIREGKEVGGPAEPFTVGVVARIVNAQEHEDGSMDLMTMGMARFRLLKSYAVHPYPSGDIELWQEEMGDARRLPRLAQAAQHAYINYIAQLAELLDEDELPSQILAPQDPQVLSYTIAANLQAPNSDKQRLLEIETVQERLECELEMLEAESAFLARVKLMRESFTRDDVGPFSVN